MYNKKVILRERKRHTTCRVASARYADLSPDPVLDGGGDGTPSSPGQRGYIIQSWMGVPWGPPSRAEWGYPPTWTWDGVPPSRPGMGYPTSSPGMGNPPITFCFTFGLTHKVKKEK